ncbi:MAG: acyl-CoA dehydrogenase [Deltaproteobacteria bacterium]|nr:acyl-CoA dehydrogenase [Deltaproteobacteria bacterium]
MIDFEPSDEQALIIETVRQFAENEIRPRCREADEAGAPSRAVLDAAHELGLVANSLPESVGGGGERSALTGALIAEELGWGDMATALAILSPGLSGLPVADFGAEGLQNAVLPSLVGDQFAPGSLAIVEPRFDFDVVHPQTTAKADGDEIVLDGLKCQVPWIEGTSQVIVIAGENGSLAGFVVPTDAAGLETEPERNMGLNGLPTVELTLSGVRVSSNARLETDDAGIRGLIDRGRIAVAATALGTARAAFEISRDYAKERETFGQPIATRQAIAFMLADMAIEIDGARLLIWEAADALDRGEPAGRLARLAQDQMTRIGLRVADGAVQVFGGHGYIRDYLPELHLRNLAGLSSFETLALV